MLQPFSKETAEETKEGQNSPPKKERTPKYIHIDEVVREREMHFYEVPKLGSYLAIKLQYKSCLFVEALEAAVLDFKDVEAR